MPEWFGRTTTEPMMKRNRASTGATQINHGSTTGGFAYTSVSAPISNSYTLTTANAIQ